MTLQPLSEKLSPILNITVLTNTRKTTMVATWCRIATAKHYLHAVGAAYQHGTKAFLTKFHFLKVAVIRIAVAHRTLCEPVFEYCYLKLMAAESDLWRKSLYTLTSFRTGTEARQNSQKLSGSRNLLGDPGK
jgi:hypothetical protein